MEPKDLIKQKLDIAEVIGEYVQLKPAGSGSFKGVCPFHSERTPSFHVSRERQIYKCFGCDKGGDIFSFVMEMEGMSFPEALRHLGAKAGVEIPEFKPQRLESPDKKNRMMQAYNFAAEYYATVLREYPFGELARKYVDSRGITPELREKFRLGAAPDAWDSLSVALMKKGFLGSELVEAGLSLQKKAGGGVLDRFRNRMMVSIADAQGNVIASTGRVIPGTPGADEGGKYVNSPETLLYKKSDVLYGLHLAKGAIRKSGTVIVVEGNLDVIASHKAGVENIVASSGTALTETQLRLLSRYAKKIVFCLDDDAAGFAAAKRALELAFTLQKDATLPVEIRCMVIPTDAGKDPDDVVQKDPALWRKLAESSFEVVEYYFQKTIRDFELSGGAASVEARTKLIDELLPQLARVSREDERHLYILRLVDATHVDADVLRGMLAKLTAAPSATKAPAPVTSTKTPPKTEDKLTRAGAFLFGLALKEESLVKPILANVPRSILQPPWSQLYGHLEEVYTHAQLQPSRPEQKETLFSRLRAYLDQAGEGQMINVLDATALRIDEIIAGLTQTERRNEAQRHLDLFSQAVGTNRKKELEAAIRHAELAGDSSKLTALMAEYASLLKTSRAP